MTPDGGQPHGGSFDALADALSQGVARGIDEASRQAAARLARDQAWAVERRLGDPLTKLLLVTFDRQVRDYAERVRAALAAGDRAQAQQWARSVERAYKNGATVRAAVYDLETDERSPHD